ncbi:uncharacterized protein LOC130755372 [Actinidia eriantha]|uniref:uncharacterized protein LOC130755372 n=1 Tax=Actinidia eriantha TaxID=165200 RepID=UPI00258408D0|nr:uncharacterized protein LOC130755372 [Actinidia eriantha]
MHYFQVHPISVYTEYSPKDVLLKADLMGRLSKWSLELGQFDIKFSPRVAIKGQVLADFVAEFSPRSVVPEQNQSKPPQAGDHNLQGLLRGDGTSDLPEGAKVIIEPPQASPSLAWEMHVDGAKNSQGAGAGVVLKSPKGAIFEQCLQFSFPATNNKAEYEALIAGLRSTNKLGVHDLCIYSDSKLVINQVMGKFKARGIKMEKYLRMAKSLISEFRTVKIDQVGRELNAHADSLAALATVFDGEISRTVAVDIISAPSIEDMHESVMVNTELGSSWMDPIVNYLCIDKLPDDKRETHRIRIKATRFWISPSGDLYKRSYQGPYLLCVHPSLIEDVLYEIHEGMCGLYSGGRSLSHRALSQGNWWPYMYKDAQVYVHKFNKCQLFSPLIHQPARDLTPLTSPWPFAQWGMDIVGVLPRALSNKRFLLAVTDYFTKWVEVEPIAQIREVDPIKFIRRNILSKFGSHRPLCQITWVDELVNVLWAYWTTPRKATNETPYSLAFEFEAVIPLEVGLPTIRTEAYDMTHNNDVLARDLDLAKERKDNALIRMADYQKQLAKSFNQKVQRREFAVGDLVLKKVVKNTKNSTDGKLGPNWEGPYKITKFAGRGSYYLEDAKRNEVPRSWNSNNLRKYFH